MLWSRKIYCLQERPCIFQPGHVTGWGSEGVKYKYLTDGAVLCKMCGPMKRYAFRKISLSLFRLVNLCVSGKKNFIIVILSCEFVCFRQCVLYDGVQGHFHHIAKQI